MQPRFVTADGNEAERLLELARMDIDERWHFSEQRVAVERAVPGQEVTA